MFSSPVHGPGKAGQPASVGLDSCLVQVADRLRLWARDPLGIGEGVAAEQSQVGAG